MQEVKMLRMCQLHKRYNVSRSTGNRWLKPRLTQYWNGKVPVYSVAEADALVAGRKS
jgi:hypothetical protein